MSRGGSGRGSSRGKAGRNRGKGKSRSSKTSTKMTVERAKAIQSHSDKYGRNLDFKSRAMSAADRNENEK